MTAVTWIFAIGIGVLWALLGKRMATRRGRNATVWPIVCFFFGPLGIITLAIVGATDEAKAAKQAEMATAVAAAVAAKTVPDVVPLSWTEEMQKLADLHDAGTLTDEEFAQEKTRLLAHH